MKILERIRDNILVQRVEGQDPTAFRRSKLIWNFTFITALFCVFYIIVGVFIDFSQGIISQCITLFLFVILLNLFRVKRLKNNLLAFLYTLISFQTVAILPLFSGGITYHSVALTWLGIVPVVSSLLSPARQSIAWFAIMVCTYTIYLVIPESYITIDYNLDYDKPFTIVVYAGLTLMIFVITHTFRISSVNAIKELELANIEINRNKQLLEVSCEKLDRSNKEIIDSIYYAKGIQRSVLPTKINRQEIIKESFCFQKPKKVLNGDFYWLEKYEGNIFFAAVDCQEHGVAGAFKSITVHNILHDILCSGITGVSDILNRLNSRLDQVFDSDEEREDNSVHISLIKWNKELRQLDMSSTKSSIVMVSDGNTDEIKFDNIPLGFLKKEKVNDISYKTKTIEIKKDTMVYLYTDGYGKQIGGLNDVAYTNQRLLQGFNNCAHLSMSEQSKNLSYRLNDWKKTHELTDDILVLGMKIQ